MFPSQFEYHRPGSVQEAARLLADLPDSKLLAGGHSLLPAMKLRLAAPGALVDLGKISELQGISVGDEIAIGAMTTYNQLVDSAEIKEAMPLIGEVASHVGDAQVRSRGTLGGSLAHSDPASDFTAVVLALGGSVDVVGSNGQRSIAVDDLFVDLFTTALETDEVITTIRIPAASGDERMAYESFEHPASGYPLVGVAARITMEADGSVKTARLAVTGCTPKATRLSGVEEAVTGSSLDEAAIEKAAGAAANGLEINGDHYASAEYRTHLLGVLVRKVLSGS